MVPVLAVLVPVDLLPLAAWSVPSPSPSPLLLGLVVLDLVRLGQSIFLARSMGFAKHPRSTVPRCPTRLPDLISTIATPTIP